MTTFMLGLVLGGATTGLVVWTLSGLVSWVPPWPTFALVTVSALGVAARDIGIASFGLPQRRQLVPRSVLDLPPYEAAARFGFELGLGFRTYLSASAPYLLVVALALSEASPVLFIAAGGAFGLGRFALAAGRYFGDVGDGWGGLIDARADLIRSLCAGLAALNAIFLAMP